MTIGPGTRVGPYEVTALLGEGGMGRVWRAHHTALQRDDALKVLPEVFAGDTERLARFQREAQVLASLNHANIAHVYGLESVDGVRALVMELVEGPTLADRIAQGPVPLDEALPIARQIAEALEAAHEEGIIHRDLKPSNIKVRDDGVVKVLDFGLAKALEPAPSPSSLSRSPTITSPAMTRLGVILGTAAYMSPEQARGKEVDTRADIWAFGCVLYEMLTGKQPFPGDDTTEIAANVLAKEPDWNALPAGIQPTLRAFLRCCLQKNPRQRVRNIGDVRLAIDGVFEAASNLNDQQHRRRRSRLALMVAGALLIAAAASSAVWWVASARTDTRTISFVVHPPDGTAFGMPTMEPYPTLSPDGRYLAFRAPLQSRNVIWVQALGDLKARPLSGTEEGVPFWSPDGRSIGFVSAGRLMKIAAFGGSAPQELCACGAAWGGTWNSDGTIVFGRTRGGLSQVSSNGGQASPVTRLDESQGEFSHRYPLFFPGGRRFVYLVRSTRAEHRGLYFGSLDDPALKRRIVPDDSNAAYGIGPDGQGYLFFVRDLVLLAQPFGVQRGELTGSPAVMARPVIPGDGGRLAPYAVEGRTMVYLRRERAENRLVWVNRGGFPEGILGVRGADYSNPALSPDGKFVAATLEDPRSGKIDIWLLDTQRPAGDRLTNLLDARFPVWLPDGDRVVYASAREGVWSIYSRSTSGSGGEESLGAPTPGTIRPRDVTRDGRFLLFSGESGIGALPLGDDRRPFLLVPEAFAARVSPDGRWLAYATGRGGQSSSAASADSEPPFEDAQVYVTTFPKPTKRWRISTTGGEDPQWSRDGREIFYIAGQTLMSVAVRAGTTFDHETPKPLFRFSVNPTGRAFGSTYAPALDGQRFLVNENLKEDPRLLAVTMNWRLDGQ